jgi:hypothetical protein
MKTLVTKTSLLVALLCVGVGAFPAGARAQASSPVAPTLIPVSGRLVGADGQPRTGQVSLVISLYNAQNDASPRWVEQQTVTLDATGAYTVQFGATLQDGLPADLFATEGGARWLGVAVREAGGDVEQPRVMLVSVPYAAKAATAETLGGKSAQDFVLSSTFREDLRTVLEEEGVRTTSSDVGAEAITNNFLQKGAGGITTDSAVYEQGGAVGIGTSTPQAALQVLGPDNTSGAFPEILISDSSPLASNVGGGFGFQGRYTASNSATFAAVKGGKDNGTSGNYTGYLSLWTQSGALTERMRITSTGAVGIGTTTPIVPVHIIGADNTAGAYPQMLLADNTAMAANVGGGFGFQGKYTTGGAYATLGAVKSGKDNAVSGSYTGYLSFWTQAGSLTERMRITSAGNVGIGTLTPTAKLHVAGDVVVDGNIGAKYQDVAEWVEASEPLEAGSLVMIDPTTTNRVHASSKAYATSVAGAVSAQPGIVLGEAGEGRVLVAQSGRVKVKADARFGAIKPGDLLVSSPTKGHLMKSKPIKMGGALVHRPGTLVGKALEALPTGQGEILVLLTLQ